MPIDLKKVVFSNEEVQAALVNYCMRHNIMMPETAISRVLVHWETAITSDMHFESDNGNGKGDVLSFSNEELAVALILFCRIHKDPLPRDAQKTLGPAGDGVSLTLRHCWGDSVKKNHPGFFIPWISQDTDLKGADGEKVGGTEPPLVVPE